MDAHNQYVFIVGLPRTGTKLVRIILEKSESPTCIISPETWFFGDLFRSGIRKVISSIGTMELDSNVERLVDFMYSGTFKRTYWILINHEEFGIDRKILTNLLLNSNRSNKAIYKAIMQAKALSSHESIDQFILGDKTPGHIFYVNTLLEWFPDAKIIHTFRDPRAIAASELRKIADARDDSSFNLVIKPFYSLIIVMYVTITWLRAAHLHSVYLKKYPSNYFMSKYEDLVLEPEKSTKAICDHIGIQVNNKMLKPKKVGSSFVTSNGKGFDKSSLYRWKSYLKPWIKLWFKIICRNKLHKFNYDK